jgi:anti-anti-sigma factor
MASVKKMGIMEPVGFSEIPFPDLVVQTRKREEKGLTIAFKGSLLAGNLPGVETFLGEMSLEGISGIDLDVRDLDFLASAGLQLLVQLSQRLKTVGGQLRILYPKPIIRKILRLTRFDQRLTIIEADN